VRVEEGREDGRGGRGGGKALHYREERCNPYPIPQGEVLLSRKRRRRRKNRFCWCRGYGRGVCNKQAQRVSFTLIRMYRHYYIYRMIVFE
jgi:hypothetical protein